jgi:FkbM family methyltransferase
MGDTMSELRRLITNQKRHEVERYFTDQTRSQYMGNDTILCKILGEKKFFAIASDLGLSPHLIFDGYWEYWLTLHFARIVEPGDTVIDIGANLGYYTILAADLAGPTGTVVAVEPNPQVFSYLLKSIAVNGYGGCVKPVNYALAGESDVRSLPFFVPAGEPKNGRFLIDGETTAQLAHFGQVFDVNVGSLAEFDFEKVDLIKIDVEGAELKVLKSLRPIIEKFSPKIVCEVNFSRGYSFEDFKNSVGNEYELLFLGFDAVVRPFTKHMADHERQGEDWLICYNG